MAASRTARSRVVRHDGCIASNGGSPPGYPIHCFRGVASDIVVVAVSEAGGAAAGGVGGVGGTGGLRGNLRPSSADGAAADTS